jgi:hypothetical protein
MTKNTVSVFLPIIGVVVGALLTFSTQYVLSSRQQESDIRKKTLELKNEQCIALWKNFADTYQYLYFSGSYSEDKIDMKGLGRHIKALSVAIVRTEPFISQNGFRGLMKVRDTLNEYYIEWEKGFPSYNEYIDFISKLEAPMNEARDVLRRELRLVDLGVVRI